jgi:hypothetical protein
MAAEKQTFDFRPDIQYGALIIVIAVVAIVVVLRIIAPFGLLAMTAVIQSQPERV